MKPLASLFAGLLAASAPAFAGPCVALDYQEMKDMSADDLVKEACKAKEMQKKNFDQRLANSSRSAPYPDAERDYDQCSGQMDRIRRVITSMGITEKLYALCERQAQGQIITAPAEAK